MSEELSGADLDRTVAEKVMGWQRVSGQTALAPFAYRRPDGHIVHPYSAPPYSSTIEAAKLVVDKMRSRGHAVEIHGDAGWWVTFEPKSFRRAASAGPSLPDAICRAALAALNGSKSE